MKVPIGGGTPISLATRMPSPTQIAVADAFVFWTDLTAGTVTRVPTGGGVASLQAPPVGIVADASGVYWIDFSDVATPSNLMKLPTGESTPVVLAQTPGMDSAIAVDATSVYWTVAGDGGSIMKIAK